MRARGIRRLPGPAATPRSDTALSSPITTGSGNLAVGRYAGQNQTTGSDNIYLANDGVAAESGRIRIGTPSTHTAAFIAGIHGANLGGSALPVFVNPNGQLGTGGGTQPPWTGDVDAGDFDLTGLRRLAFGPVLETSGGFNLDMPNSTGHGFTIASAESPLGGGFGIARDTTATIGFNWNEGGVNHGTPFNPSWGLAFESNFPTGAWPSDTVQEFHMVSQAGRTSGTVASGAGFAAGQVVVVEEPGNGATVGIGILKSIGAGAGRNRRHRLDLQRERRHQPTERRGYGGGREQHDGREPFGNLCDERRRVVGLPVSHLR